MGRAVAAVAVVAIVVCLLAVWALCRAAALGDRIGERLHDARGREEDARCAGRRSSGRGSGRTSG